MKIVLDLSDLVERGQLTPVEAQRLRGLAALNASTVAVNLLIGFGLAAVVASIGALMPTAATAVFLGALLVVIGVGLRWGAAKALHLLSQICVVVGAFSLCGGLVVLDEGSLRVILLGTLILTALSVLVRSGLLIACAVLTIGAALGSSTNYSHALYELSVEQPTLTILVFSLIAALAYAVSLQLPAAYERLALIAARVAVLAVNFGFLVGTLFGDNMARWRAVVDRNPALVITDDVSTRIPAGAFAIAWAIALVAVAAWAYRVNRMWVVNTVAVFGALHFYTQWFERLGANPVGVLGAGLLTLAFALGLWHFNRRVAPPQPA